MLKTLMNEKTTILLCIVGVIAITLLAAMGKIDGASAVQYILGALGIGGARQIISGIQSSTPPQKNPS
ncbi:MAG: hypothetical protein AB1752_12860 [Candidatus Zixiibacteriota bacterium]